MPLVPPGCTRCSWYVTAGHPGLGRLGILSRARAPPGGALVRTRPGPYGPASSALLIAFLLAACGGGSSPASVAHIGKSAPTTTVPPSVGSGGMPSLPQLYQDVLAYAGCMRSHGDPTFSPPTTVDNAGDQVVGWANPVT